MSDTTTSNPVGRPRTIETKEQWNLFDSLVQMHCTQEEIAYVFKCSIDSVTRACQEKHGVNFAEYFKANAVGGRMSLRRQLWMNALGNQELGIKAHAATAIFLSKQKEHHGGLGFSDKLTSEHDVGTGSYEQLMGIVDRLEKKKAAEG